MSRYGPGDYELGDRVIARSQIDVHGDVPAGARGTVIVIETDLGALHVRFDGHGPWIGVRLDEIEPLSAIELLGELVEP